MCQMHGGYLVHVDSQSEDDFLQQLMKQNGSKYYLKLRYNIFTFKLSIQIMPQYMYHFQILRSHVNNTFIVYVRINTIILFVFKTSLVKPNESFNLATKY